MLLDVGKYCFMRLSGSSLKVPIKRMSLLQVPVSKLMSAMAQTAARDSNDLPAYHVRQMLYEAVHAAGCQTYAWEDDVK